MLSRCERNITEFEIEFHAALDYAQKGIDTQNFEIQREGIFRVADSFMRITNMTWQCYQVELVIEYAIAAYVMPNTYNPLIILANCMSESFYIVSAILA